MLEETLLADLANEFPHAVRLQRLVGALRERFRCGAVALLRLEGESLTPVAVDGLVQETLGRRFAVAQHPRLAAILASRQPVRFDPASTLPDPYDGLLQTQVGAPLPVHDCMGISLHIEGSPWGVLTLDALDASAFDDAAPALQRCTLLVEAAVRVTRLEQEGLSLRAGRIGDSAGPPPDSAEILGHSAPIRKLLQELDVVADSELPVLLLGETGVGKELFAHRLHRHSRRHRRPLVHVNCAALPESLAESELFGHTKGAFSGALQDRPGRFEAADGGSLFLDEVGELPLTVQAKLLRTLQNGEIQRLGADQPRRVNVRIIAATNRQLSESVRNGDFRADLYHRLSVYPVPIPPLRERGSDVLVLAGHFLELNRARLGLRSLRLAPAAEAALCHYAWPGNVRELEHVISRAALKALTHGAKRHEIVSLEAQWLDIQTSQENPPTAERPAPAAPPVRDMSLSEAMAAYQREIIRAALERHGSWANAARALDVDPSNLHKLAKRLGLK
jgi:anaerobic nitric oxide reductase transcription regulator